MKKIVSLLLLATVALLAACSAKSDEGATKEKLNVYTTVYPLTYFTERIAGDAVTVQSIYPPGANEHTFEPTQKDMMKLAEADVFFYIGLGLESFVDKAQKTLAKSDNITFVATADQVPHELLDVSTGHVHAEEDEHGHDHEHEGHDHGHEGEEVDAHVWLSPQISQQLAKEILTTLVAKMPEQEQAFTKNYDALVKELDALDADYRNALKDVKQHTFFVSHAAFGYIAGNYGLHQVPIAGLNSQSEPSQKALMQIVKKAKDEKISTIFFEQNVSSKLTEVIQKEVGAEAAVLHNLSVLTTDDIANKEDYFTLMQKNKEALQKALQ
ncbi:adhesin [Lysinibacillus sp. BF-4]|uniref:metal ABC transporter solute-binding protein, Zn/Mn family n=1 Tax=Lysinibacillus sp. BF-4 TaxID=1473546 RepID=UPI000502C9EA|nr:zinc ABC transporter substrate-binding protein [Lysinibacillus sp. BF-4]KFL44224.1 adhesin [Lysinibacillus sp. BF-4]